MDAESIRDLFGAVGPVRIRRMFGGQGLFVGELMFGLEAGGELYLKTDPESAGAFEAEGSARFTYRRQGKPASLGYWRLPDRALDDPEEAGRWARLAVEAARRAAAAKAARRRKR